MLGAASAGPRVVGVGDGMAPTGTKLGLFGLLLHGGCCWQDMVQCQARRGNFRPSAMFSKLS